MTESIKFESYQDAVREVARVCGGTKPLATLLWSTKTPQQAHSHLLDCLNTDRPHKLSPDELITIARLGRERGCDALMEFIAGETGYEIKPVDDEKLLEGLKDRIAVGLEYLQANMELLKRIDARKSLAKAKK